MLADFTNWALNIFGQLDYTGIVVLMTIESSLIPFPSEIVMPPAGYLAATGKLNIIWVVLAGTLGSLLGAWFNYFLALTLGRKVMHHFARSRWAGLILFNEEKLVTAEQYFKDHGKMSTFLGRFIPAVRQLVSLPAGLAKMNLASFSFYTGLGAGIWVLILTLLGYWFGANQALLSNYYRQIYYAGIALSIIIILYLIKKHVLRQK
jgi:membrane protein DedA with SNARE-associated domain